MSVDDRLRRGLGANASAFDPEVETCLEAVRRRGRRAASARTAGAGVSAVVAAAAVVLVALAVLPGVPQDRSPAPSVPVASPTAALFSRYEGDVTRPSRLAGHWVVELRGNGSALVTPPAGYAGVVSGTIFTADRARLRINLFAQDVCADFGDGEYAWTRQGNRLLLTASNDACRSRTRFFTANTWIEVSQL